MNEVGFFKSKYSATNGFACFLVKEPVFYIRKKYGYKIK